MQLYKLLILVFILIPTVGFSDTKIVDGKMSFEFTLKSRNQELLDDFYEYENNSNSQKIVERGSGFITVRTTAKLGRLDTDIPFPAAERYNEPKFKEHLDYSTSRKGIEITRGNGQIVKREFVERTPMTDSEIELLERTARSVTEGASSQHQAVEAVMRYIRENVSYTLRSSSNPADVLRTGKAYCEGYANVAALLLRVVGVPAKVVDSYIPPGHMWGYGQEGGGGYHAHVEVYYADAGWVSYDPQATVHFVDPFHIVNYPREKVNLQQGPEQDQRNIIDILTGPTGTNNFFQRDTTDSRNSAVFTGVIHRSDGSIVRDSFRSNEWVYMRKSDGSATGIRILSNGQFAVPANEPRTIFYRDGQGGWYEQRIQLDEKELVFEEIRLDANERMIHIDLDGARQLFLWYRSPDSRWMLEKVNTDSKGMIRLLSDSVDAVVSTRNTPVARKFELNAGELREGETYLIGNLPQYLDPNTPYVSIIPPSAADYTLKFIELSSGRTYQGPDIDVERSIAAIPDKDFSTAVLQREGVVAVTSLPSLSEGKVSTAEIEQNSLKFDIEAERSDYPVHITIKRGGRYASLVSGSTDSSGRLTLFFDRSLLEENPESFVLLHGSPISRQRVLLGETPEGTIRLE
ncbi:MAG: transglutaminase-like domain-containing protein [Spirochaetota bacterium]